MSKTKAEIIVTTASEVMGIAEPDNWGLDNLEAKDMLISRILMAQKMSEAVDKDNVKPGQFYRSSDKKIYGGLKEPFSFLVLNLFKSWTIEKKVGDRYEYDSVIPYAPSEAQLPWDFEEEGVTKRRNETFNFYIIPILDIEANEVIPSVLSFRRTQVQCAKSIVSFMILMKQYKTPPCTYVLELTSTLKETDLGSFYVPQMKKGRKASPEDVALCKEWFESINKSSVQVNPETGEIL